MGSRRVVPVCDHAAGLDETECLAAQDRFYADLLVALADVDLYEHESLRPAAKHSARVTSYVPGAIVDEAALRAMFAASERNSRARKPMALSHAQREAKVRKTADAANALAAEHESLHLLFGEQPCDPSRTCSARIRPLREHRARSQQLAEVYVQLVRYAETVVEGAVEGEGGLGDFVHTMQKAGLSYGEIAFLQLRLRQEKNGQPPLVRTEPHRSATTAARKARETHHKVWVGAKVIPRKTHHSKTKREK